MSHPSLAALVSVIAIACADTAPPGTAPRTPDGRPDLQGYWTTQTFTPLERPDYLAGQEFFTDEEAAALDQQLTAEGVDPSRATPSISRMQRRERRGLIRLTARLRTYTTTTRSGCVRPCQRVSRAGAHR